MNLKNVALWIVKIGLVGAIMYWLIQSGRMDWSKLTRLVTHPGLSLSALALIAFGTTLLVVLRWQMLLKAHDVHSPWTRLFAIHWISLFFATFLPGAVSGDGVKAFYVYKESPAGTGKTPILTSLIVDRLLGLSGLLAVGLVAYVVAAPSLVQSPELQLLGLAMLGLFSGMALFLILVVRRQRAGGDRIASLLSKLPASGLLLKVYNAFRTYREHRRALFWGFWLSFAGQAVLALGVWILADLACDCSPGIKGIFLATPLGELSTAIPLGPLGVGVGHGAFEYLFQMQGIPAGADTFNLFTADRLLMGAIGGLVYLFFRAQDGAPETLEDPFEEPLAEQEANS